MATIAGFSTPPQRTDNLGCCGSVLTSTVKFFRGDVPGQENSTVVKVIKHWAAFILCIAMAVTIVLIPLLFSILKEVTLQRADEETQAAWGKAFRAADQSERALQAQKTQIEQNLARALHHNAALKRDNTGFTELTGRLENDLGREVEKVERLERQLQQAQQPPSSASSSSASTGSAPGPQGGPQSLLSPTSKDKVSKHRKNLGAVPPLPPGQTTHPHQHQHLHQQHQHVHQHPQPQPASNPPSQSIPIPTPTPTPSAPTSTTPPTQQATT